MHAITKYHPLVINKKLRNTNSTQIQHKFNKFNEIWPKLIIFYQNYQHKLNTN